MTRGSAGAGGVIAVLVSVAEPAVQGGLDPISTETAPPPCAAQVRALGKGRRNFRQGLAQVLIPSHQGR